MVRHRWLPRVAVGVFTTCFALGAAELLARGVIPAPPDNTREPHIVYRPDAEIRYVHVPNQRGWIDEAQVTINALGFRGADIALPKPAGRFRVAAIGDSVTLGWGVGDSDTFSARLERLVRERHAGGDVDVVNLGVSGYDTRQEVTLLGRFVDRLQPDLVVVGFLANDVPEALDDPGPQPPAHGAAADRVIQINPGAATGWERIVRRSRILYTSARFVRRVTATGEWGRSRYTMELEILEGHETPDVDRAWGKVREQLGRLAAMAAEHHFRVAVVVLPSREQVDGQFKDARFVPTIRAMAAPLGFDVIDALPAMAGARQAGAAPLFIPYDRIHPSAAGHDAIATAIYDSIAPRLQNAQGK